MPEYKSVIEAFNKSVEAAQEDMARWENADWTYEGLCNFFAYLPPRVDKIAVLFNPTEEDKKQLLKEGKSITYWGSDSISSRNYNLTGLRLTIIFFIAAMNNEL